MRDLEQNPYTTEERIDLRIRMEGQGSVGDGDYITHLELQHPANLLAQTAVVRRDALDTTGPDLDAFAAAFATALTQHDEEYL